MFQIFNLLPLYLLQYLVFYILCGLSMWSPEEKIPDLYAFCVNIHSIVGIICINITELSPIIIPDQKRR